jgi:WD40 repeat protein
MLWDIPRLEIVATAQLEKRPRIYSVAFSPDGTMLAAATGNRDPKLVQPGDIILLSAAALDKRMTLQGHRGAVHSLAFSSDGRMLASGSEDRTVKLWDLSRPAAKKE